MLVLHPWVSGVVADRHFPEVGEQIWDHAYPRLHDHQASRRTALMMVIDMIRLAMTLHVITCHLTQVTIVKTTAVIRKGWYVFDRGHYKKYWELGGDKVSEIYM